MSCHAVGCWLTSIKWTLEKKTKLYLKINSPNEMFCTG